MQDARFQNASVLPPREMSPVPALCTMALAVGIAAFWYLLAGDAFSSYPYLFLVPWIVGLGVVLAVPSVVLYYKGRFTFADPIVFATWSYFFPAFVIGGFFFTVGWSQPHFLSLVQDVEETLPLTITLVALGFGGLSVGYFLPWGERLGRVISDRLPKRIYPLRNYLGPGVLLLSIGIINTGIALTLGLFGYQKNADITRYDGLIWVTTLFWLQGSFLLWYIIFRHTKLDVILLPVIVLLVSTSITRIIFAGNRGSIIQIFAGIALAYILSGRRFKLKQSLVAGTLLTVFLILGMIYGTTFRAVKGTESTQGVSEYTENVLTTMSEVGNADFGKSLEYGLSSLAERVDILTTLAVVVSNYEVLKPYEEAYGLDNNIWVDTTTFFIPRIVWKDKPVPSDPRKYSDLYFSWGDNSFAITPIGDLLRNYGIIGVPIGMLLLGIILRVIYRALVERQVPTVWRMALYFMLLTTISYEGFYGTILPTLVKVAVASGVGMIVVTLLVILITRQIKAADVA